MAIRVQIIVEVAAVDVTDEYRVELHQEKKRTTYSSTQAREIARELIEAAGRADAAVHEDMEARGLRMESAQLVTREGEVVL